MKVFIYIIKLDNIRGENFKSTTCWTEVSKYFKDVRNKRETKKYIQIDLEFSDQLMYRAQDFVLQIQFQAEAFFSLICDLYC